MEIKDIKKLAKDIMFEVSDLEANEILNDFKKIDKMLLEFEKIDTNNVEEMIYPIDIETNFLRQDDPTHIISVEDVLKNVNNSKQDHIVVPKVVK